MIATGWSHDDSTALLRDLMAHVWESTGRPAHSQALACAGENFRLFSNDPVLFKKLTFCALPAETDAPPDFEVLALAGPLPGAGGIPPWNIPHTDRKHLERIHVGADRRFAAYYEMDRRYWMMWDAETRRGLLWIHDPNDLPCWDDAAPLRMIFNWRFSSIDTVMIHSGAVGRDRAVLLVGPGGSGKSTTVAACVASAFGSCGDDLAAVAVRNGEVRVWTLFDAIKLDPHGPIRGALDFTKTPSIACGEKTIYRLSDIAPGSVVRSAPVAAILRPIVARRPETTIVPESKAAMLRALGPPTAFLLRGMEDDTLAKIGALVRALPTYRMELGLEPLEAAHALRTWMEEFTR